MSFMFHLHLMVGFLLSHLLPLKTKCHVVYMHLHESTETNSGSKLYFNFLFQNVPRPMCFSCKPIVDGMVL